MITTVPQLMQWRGVQRELDDLRARGEWSPYPLESVDPFDDDSCIEPPRAYPRPATVKSIDGCFMLDESDFFDIVDDQLITTPHDRRAVDCDAVTVALPVRMGPLISTDEDYFLPSDGVPLQIGREYHTLPAAPNSSRPLPFTPEDFESWHDRK